MTNQEKIELLCKLLGNSMIDNSKSRELYIKINSMLYDDFNDDVLFDCIDELTQEINKLQEQIADDENKNEEIERLEDEVSSLENDISEMHDDIDDLKLVSHLLVSSPSTIGIVACTYRSALSGELLSINSLSAPNEPAPTSMTTVLL